MFDDNLDDKQDKIRDRAYQIWQDEGQPDGQDERHWHQAAEEVGYTGEGVLPTQTTPVAPLSNGFDAQPVEADPIAVVSPVRATRRKA